MTRTPAIRWSLLLAALFLLATSTAWGQDYPRLGLHGRIHGTGFPFVLGDSTSGPLNPVVLDMYARYNEITIGASPISEYRPEILTELRLRRPDIQIDAYVIGQAMWQVPVVSDSLVFFPSRQQRLIRDNDGYLYNKKGQYYSFANVNLAKQVSGRFVIAEGLADLFYDVIASSGLWDGIFIDQFCNSIVWSQTAAESIDVVRAGYPSVAAFDAGWIAATDTLANRLRRLAGPDFVLVGNCGQGVKYASMNGWMRENFPFQNGGTWYSNMYNDPGGYFVDEAKFRAPTHNYIFSASFMSPSMPYDSVNQRRVRFGLGSAALGNGYGIFGPSDLDDLQYPYYAWWFDEYAVDVTTARADSNTAHTGWLGQALAPSYQMIWVGTNPDAVTNSGFEADLSGWTFRNNGIAATWDRDATTAAVGNASAHVTALVRGGADFSVNLSTTGTLLVTAGQLYSATFWAKASHPTRMTVVAGVSGAGEVASRAVDIGTTWQQYQVSLTPSATQSVQLLFYVGQIEAELWLDDVHFQAGASSLYRRDFQNGIVLVNPASTPMTVPLGRPFRRILGFRDPVTNDGTSITSITVPANDARFLIGLDTIPPAAVNDLHPSPQ
jgi:hypothetical protein